jgi:dolichyl-phosphate beta-glucosyltransferase
VSTTASTPHLTLVIPVYNGAERLPGAFSQISAFLAEQSYAWELIICDDHSAEPARQAIEQFVCAHPCTRVIRNEKNLGKGATVARGLQAGSGRYRVFTDADLAYPPEEVNAILRRLEAGADVAVACRVLRESRYEMSPSFFHYLYTRHLMSRMFNRLVRVFLLRGIYDTQAGLKGFSARAVETIFPRVTIPRFGFDVEALFIAQKHQLRIEQTPVHFRYDDEPTTVHFIRAASQMAADLLHVRVANWRGQYD